MKITKNGFYKLSEIIDENIEVEKDLNVVFYDNGKKYRKINIGENCRVYIYGFLEFYFEGNLEIFLNEKNTKLNLGYLLLSGNKKLLKSKISTKILANSSSCEMKIISIVGNDGIIDFDGIINIEKGIQKINGSLVEENLFIGNSGKITCVPSLFVSSYDVKASHSCKIERINKEKLFYLKSRGIQKEEALKMLLESYIKNLFKCFGMIDNNFYLNLVEEIMQKIKNEKFNF